MVRTINSPIVAADPAPDGRRRRTSQARRHPVRPPDADSCAVAAPRPRAGTRSPTPHQAASHHAMRHPLPYAFATPTSCCWKTTATHVDAVDAGDTRQSPLAEVQRQYRRRPPCEREPRGHLSATASPQPTPGGESSAATVVGEVESDADLSRMMQDMPAVEDLLEAADDAPIIRMINALLTQAARRRRQRHPHRAVRAPFSRCAFASTARLREVVQPNRALHAALISRLKIMAELDIAEKRLPQDGRITLRIGGTRGRRARLHPAQRPRRARGAAPAGQERTQAQPRSGWA